MSKEINGNNEKSELNSSSITFGLLVNYFKPSIFVEGIDDININSLKDNGVKLIICDLDNTLVPHFTKFPTKRVIDFVERIEKSGIKFVIISNNSKKRVEFFSQKLKSKNDYIANAKKPLTKHIKRYLKDKNYRREEILFIGDMLVTDILVANILNIDSILVLPLVGNDPISNWFTKFLEKRIFNRLSRGNILNTDNLDVRDKILDNFELL